MFDVAAFLQDIGDAFAGGVSSHMPFVVHDELVLCCLRDPGGVWKAHSWAPGGFSRIPTGLPDGAVECCPQASTNAAGDVVLSVVSDHPYSFAVHSFAGSGVGSVRRGGARHTAHAGFEHAGLTATAGKVVEAGDRRVVTVSTLRVVDGSGNAIVDVRFLAGRQVVHVAPVVPAGLVVTLYSRAAGEESLLVSTDGAFRVSRLVLPDGRSPYKPHLYGGLLLHAAKSGPGFEDRRIEATAVFDAVPQSSGDWFTQEV